MIILQTLSSILLRQSFFFFFLRRAEPVFTEHPLSISCVLGTEREIGAESQNSEDHQHNKASARRVLRAPVPDLTAGDRSEIMKGKGGLE